MPIVVSLTEHFASACSFRELAVPFCVVFGVVLSLLLDEHLPAPINIRGRAQEEQQQSEA